jgi:hypothetical protein
MELANSFFPMRAVIRCQAKQQLLQNLNWVDLDEPLDEALLKDVTATLFRLERYEQLYRHCHTAARAAEIDVELAIAAAQAYQRIKRQQADPIVQQLNQMV